MRQPTESTSTPERVGPIAGANEIIRPTMPIAAPRCSRGNTRRMSVNTMGMMMPVAHAIMTRPRRMTSKFGAHAAMMHEMQNQPMPPMNSLRVLKRPTKKAFSGMTTASTKE